METILLISTALALIGAYLNSIGKWQGFAVWIATNIVFMLNNWWIGQWQQAILFSCYLFLAINGLRHSLGQSRQLKKEKERKDSFQQSKEYVFKKYDQLFKNLADK
jgi:hypothetical protein